MKKQKLQETRHLFWEELRKYCIRNGYYTLGTNEEFDELYHLLPRTQCREGLRESEHVTTEDLLTIAQNIMLHSEPSKFELMDLGTLVFSINDECCVDCFLFVDC